MELKEKNVYIIIWAAPMTGVMVDFLNRPATSSCFFGKGYSSLFMVILAYFSLCENNNEVFVQDSESAAKNIRWRPGGKVSFEMVPLSCQHISKFGKSSRLLPPRRRSVSRSSQSPDAHISRAICTHFLRMFSGTYILHPRNFNVYITWKYDFQKTYCILFEHIRASTPSHSGKWGFRLGFRSLLLGRARGECLWEVWPMASSFASAQWPLWSKLDPNKTT